MATNQSVALTIFDETSHEGGSRACRCVIPLSRRCWNESSSEEEDREDRLLTVVATPLLERFPSRRRGSRRARRRSRSPRYGLLQQFPSRRRGSRVYLQVRAISQAPRLLRTQAICRYLVGLCFVFRLCGCQRARRAWKPVQREMHARPWVFPLRPSVHWNRLRLRRRVRARGSGHPPRGGGPSPSPRTPVACGSATWASTCRRLRTCSHDANPASSACVSARSS